MSKRGRATTSCRTQLASAASPSRLGNAGCNDFRYLSYTCFLRVDPQVFESAEFNLSQGCLSSRSNKSCNEAGNDQGDSPGEVEIKPRPLQDAHSQFLIDDHCNETRDQRVPKGVNNNCDCCEPRMIQEIKIRAIHRMCAIRSMYGF